MDTWARFHFNPLGIRSMNPFEGEEFQQLFEEQQRGEAPLADIPLIVLIAGDKPGTVNDQRKVDADPGRKIQMEKRHQKIAQALLSRNGKYLIVQSGHEIHLYEPSWVIEAIREVVDAVRKQRPLS
jgi:hypothetical protein